ncbi:UBX domain-containing protein 11 isoform X1 [Scyliorhinus canicula]|uniref:UBX domain-containing protein 11 isoform X1 n=2 Tax=Scyliorhinus canicula TaxID=7830 RepID=UPI0018F60A31|nr:UBX domain-containing protein 11 isoform X1 [Scyliorhinus canicula]
MSSPLASLGKLRKVSLLLPELQDHSKRAVCFEKECYTDDEAALLSEILPPLSWSHSSTSSTSSSPSKSKAKDSKLSDTELMSTMVKRLTEMEQRVQTQAQEISRKNQKIAVLEEKLSLLQLSNADKPKRQQELEKLLQLQNQVWEMEKFLNDYGMIWIGSEKDEASSVYLKEEEEPQEPPDPSGLILHPGDSAMKSFQVDFDLVLENIKDLNILAGEGEARIEHITGGARLKRPDPLSLTLFKNGIVMFNGPFRSFNELSTQHCLQDIMDGYFPSELQHKYPAGIPMKVTDKRDVIFRDRRLHAEFPGVGQTIGGGRIPRVSAEQDSKLVKETSEIPGPKLSVEQFLNKLPKTVIRAGKVINIRGDIKDILQVPQVPSSPSDDNTVLIETPILAELRERLKFSEDNRPASRNISTLRIKSENGEKTYIVKMLFNETVGDLRTYLNQIRGKQEVDYDIISTFPQQVYNDQSKTLKEYGLIPNAMLILRTQRTQLIDHKQGAVSKK